MGKLGSFGLTWQCQSPQQPGKTLYHQAGNQSKVCSLMLGQGPNGTVFVWRGCLAVSQANRGDRKTEKQVLSQETLPHLEIWFPQTRGGKTRVFQGRAPLLELPTRFHPYGQRRVSSKGDSRFTYPRQDSEPKNS